MKPLPHWDTQIMTCFWSYLTCQTKMLKRKVVDQLVLRAYYNFIQMSSIYSAKIQCFFKLFNYRQHHSVPWQAIEIGGYLANDAPNRK